MTHPPLSSNTQPKLLEETLQKALQLFKDGNIGEAEAQFLAMLKIQADHPDANYYLGLLALHNNQPSNSLTYFETALDQKPDHAPYWLAYIDALDQTGKTAEAREIMTIAQQAGLAGDETDTLAARLGMKADVVPPKDSNTPSLAGKTQDRLPDAPAPEQNLIDDIVLLYDQGRVPECENLARSILARFPHHGFTWKVLGALLNQQKRLDEAIAAMRQSVQFLPQDPEALNNLGLTLKNKGLLAESEATLRLALALNNEFAEAYNNLGVTLMAQGRLNDSETCFRQALRIKPQYPEACCNLGINLKDQGRFAESEENFEYALKLRPSYAEAYNNLGNVLHGTGRLSEAEASLRKAIELKPDFAIAYNNLGNALHCQGHLEESEHCYHTALDLKPDYPEAFDGLLFVSNYHPDKTDREIYQLYREYDKCFGLPYHNRLAPHGNSCDTSRRLKVGYVSPSFYKHPVFHFLEPLLAHHDTTSFELYAYAEITREDQITACYKQHVHHWIPTVGLSDDELAQRIRSDEIDILVDLAGHTGRNRLGVFARKPAPVSLHWLDFGYTTGLSAIDYYLTDISSAPVGSENLFSEQLWRLPAPAFAYRPAEDMGRVSPLPASQRGYVTFGTLTRAIRINHRTIRVWSEILRRAEGSRLVIDSGNFKDPAIRQTLKEKFAMQGIDGNRLEIGYHSPPWDVLRNIDIGLDCFPHNSGTTLFESLYMGVPFITLAGRPGTGRLGCSVLEGAGHPEWAAKSEDEYIERALSLASDLPTLTSIRAGLRQSMQDSPLMDEKGFAGRVEEAYRRMFAHWCEHPISAKGNTENSSLVNNRKPPRTPDDSIAQYNLGVDLQQQGRIAEAKNLYIQAVNTHQTFVEAYNNLGVIYQQEGKFSEAEACFFQALEIKQDYADGYYNLANTCKLQQKLFDAEENYRKVIEILPDNADAHYNLGNILQEQGRPHEAENCLRHALQLRPNHIKAFSTLLFALNYHPDKSSEEIFQSYREFNARFCLPCHAGWLPHANSRKENRRLKIGYVAPDYRRHPARYFLEPLLAHHDKRLVETYAYVELSTEDAATDLFHGYVDNWAATAGLTDDQISMQIRNDGIDILVDLAGHTAGNRLGVFARKPAPISLHWLDFGYTTGLTAIDYYLTDQATVPAGSERFFSEIPWRLATPALAYRPPDNTGPVNDLPAQKNGYITFGTLTRAVRINHRTIRVWSEILKGCEGSRLIINSGSFREPAMQEALARRFMAHDIARERLDIGCESPPWDVLRNIDIGLDCFPHNSGTTLVESLYMGVPSITLANRPSVGRLGCSILEGIGHREWIAETEEEYILKAVSLAADLPKLASIRMHLREDMAKSPLMDEAGFAGKVEAAYREMFRQWCASPQLTAGSADSQRGRKNSRKKEQEILKKKRIGESFRKEPHAHEINQLTQVFNQGKSAEATEIARSLTVRFPRHGFGWKVLGPLLHRQGLTQEAIQAMKHAALYLPDDPETHYNLGIALQQAGLLAEAEDSYRRTLHLNRDHFQAQYNLGNILRGTGRLAEAEKCYRRAVALKPDFLEALCNLGNILKAQGKLGESADSYRTALTIRPDSEEIYNNLSLVLKEQGLLAGADRTLLAEAERACKQALNLKPDFPEAHNNLGIIYQGQSRFAEAEICYRRAIELQPNYSIAYYNLGLILQKQGRLNEAELICHQALQVDPNNAQVYKTLGSIQSFQGRFDEAESNLRRSLEINPNYTVAHSTLLFLLNYHPDRSAEDIFAEYRKFNARFGFPLQTEWQPHTNDHNADRRLKVGYVSRHFSAHSMRHFLEPLLAHHDKTAVEIYAYADMYQEDRIADRYKSYVDNWINIKGLNDADLTKRIRDDGIDILVDLAGHTGGNRLGVFARKPAPVSLHWLDFGYTTGLTAIDYYLTDNATVPTGSEGLFAETPWRIETPCLVYRPAPGMGEVGALPAAARGHVTFGTLTRAVRINHRTIRVWAEILKRVEGSHLVIDSRSFQDTAMQERLADKFIAHGIARERLEVGYHSPPWDVLRGLDIGFDCFPHNSGTTLFETLYMGVPFITLADRPSVGRLGCSILAGLDHPEWIAYTEEEYVELAVALATTDLHKLGALRAGLRKEMEQSPLMDEPAFARKVESAYKEMFGRWCARNESIRPHDAAQSAAQPLPDETSRLISLFRSGNYAEGEALARSLLKRFPKNGFVWKALGTILQQQGKLDEALSALQQALAILRNDAELHNNLAGILSQKGLHGEAEAELRKALKINPKYVEAYFNLGNTLQKLGRYLESDAHYRQALDLKEDYAEVYCNLGNSLIKQNRQIEAENCYKRAIELKSDFVEAHNNLGNILQGQGRLSESEATYHRVLELNPKFAEGYSNLGNTLRALGRLTEAEITMRLALKFMPDSAEMQSNLGNILINQGRLNEAEKSLRLALQLNPGYAQPHSNLLFLLNYHPDRNSEEIYDEYKKFNARFGLPLQQTWQPHCNSRQTHRRLKVGYVAPQLRRHSACHFLEPLLAHHDKKMVEVYAYAELLREDDQTERYKVLVDHWIITAGMSDAVMAEKIRAEKIDILVDLAGHTEGNRLGVFARKPAPVSLHWLDFGYSTGLTAIDYYLTDYATAPAGSEGLFSEALWRVETPCLAYRPAEDMGAVSPLPATTRGYITFGTLTRAARINHRTIRVWSEIMKRVAGSQLVIDSGDFNDPYLQASLADKFVAHGIERERLKIGFHSPPWDVLRSLDIGFDCFPHNSGTTLFETLYMGVPFITLAERPSVGRLGSCLLEAIGHSEWIAGTEAEYVELAAGLASDLQRLATLRTALRQEMKNSPLMDEPAFARKVELAYKAMFAKWCANEQSVQLPMEMEETAATALQQTLENAENSYQAGQFREAEVFYRRALAHNPDVAECHYALANTLIELGRWEEAEASYRKSLELKPDFTEALGNLGNTLQRQGKIPEAEVCYRHALSIKADFAEAYFNLGNLLREQNRLTEAQEQYHNALEYKPNYYKAYSNLGVALQLQGQHQEAEKNYRKAIGIQPDFVDGYINLGACLKEQGRYREAEKSYTDALAINPDHALCCSNLGSVLKEHGQLAEAEKWLRRALELKPDYAEAFSNLLFLLNYHPDASAESIFDEYQNFNTRYCLPLQKNWTLHANSRQADRRLKIGYVSPQFRLHSIRHFLEPLLAHHDKRQVEIFAYADVGNEDTVTARYRSYVDHWLTAVGLDNATLAERIRADGIDILVDLAGHTVNNRLKTFALKPAPVSLHWLDFGNTTGLTAIDYYLTDPATAPEGSDTLFSEIPWRLATPCLVYRPAEGMGEVTPLPALSRGYITFGTLTRAVRINHRTIRVWSEILKRVENSHLIIDSSNFKNTAMQEELAEKFLSHGIGRERLEIGYHSPPWDVLRSLDISLDCFPHNSGTTLLETLYMGVPFVTLADRPSVGRLGCSVLEGLGQAEWTAFTEEQYIELAVALASDLQKLADIRKNLRQKMEKSPLMDEPAFARKVEAAYKEMFAKWCATEQPIATTPGGKEADASHQSILHQADIFYQDGQFQEAKGACLSILGADPQHAEANYLMGCIEVACQQPSAALPFFVTAVDARPEHGPYWLAYIDALDKAGRSASARQLLDMAVQAGLDGEEATALQNRLTAETIKPPAEKNKHAAAAKSINKKSSKRQGKTRNSAASPHPDETNRLAALFQQGNLPEAESLAQSLIHRFPHNSLVWKILGAIRRQQGLFEQALLAMEKAITFMPKDYICLRNIGVILCDLERYVEAEGYCRSSLKIKPDYADAYTTLSIALRSQKKLAEAERSCRKALKLKPDSAEIFVNLGLILNEEKKYAEAETCFLKSLERNPAIPEAYCGLGSTLKAAGRMPEAEKACRQALTLKPDSAAAHNALASVLNEQERYEEAATLYRRALILKPSYVEALHNLGKTLYNQGKSAEAESCCRQVLQTDAGNAEAYFTLGNVLADQGRHQEAEINYRAALQIRPDYPDASINLGNMYRMQGWIIEAEKTYRNTLQMHPEYEKAYNNLGNILQEQGRLAEAETILRTVLDFKPDFTGAYGNLLFLLNYHPDKSGEEIFREYQKFEERFGRPLRTEWQAHTNNRDKSRRMKIGYVSPKFCQHPVCNFLEPLLAHHNKDLVELYAYAEIIKEDAATERYRSYMDHWIPTRGMTDAEMAECIRRDGIDILVDLAGHTDQNRLLVFARKPAPVSLHWLDFGYTTGLTAIDYYLSDSASVPVGSEGLFAEAPWRLETPCFVYRPKEGMGEVNTLPALERGYITFGSLSRAVRINHRTIRAWAAILKRVEGSHMVINSGNFKDPAMQNMLAERFIAHGIDRERMAIGYDSPPWDVIRSLDIGLDCFPHNSGTTLFETLYMGIPFVTLAGRASVGRLGCSVLEGLGHPELIASSEEDYVERAVTLAANLPGLAKLRAGLRREMEKSPLMDEPAFARRVETAYREMFVKWCEEWK